MLEQCLFLIAYLFLHPPSIYFQFIFEFFRSLPIHKCPLAFLPDFSATWDYLGGGEYQPPFLVPLFFQGLIPWVSSSFKRSKSGFLKVRTVVLLSVLLSLKNSTTSLSVQPKAVSDFLTCNRPFLLRLSYQKTTFSHQLLFPFGQEVATNALQEPSRLLYPAIPMSEVKLQLTLHP